MIGMEIGMIEQHGKEFVKAEQKFRQLREKLGRVENKYWFLEQGEEGIR